MKRTGITAMLALLCMMVTACGLGSGSQMTVSITDFGAVSDGSALCTASINDAISNLFSPLCVTLGAENNGENLLVENVTATGIDGFALSVKTWTDSRFRNVTIRNSAFQYKGQDNPDFLHIKELPFDRWPSFPTWGAWFRNVDSLKIEGVDFSLDGNDPREAVGSY